jgi:glycosyltransferase involved in cell wall biosynthesis
MFQNMGVQTVKLEPRLPGEPFDQLVGGRDYPVSSTKDPADVPPVFDGPLVSVIMTAYNVEGYIETAARSILQQSYRNLELIIVDDCSTDSTPELLKRLEAWDPRVKIILKATNDGTYVSKNMGLLQSSGEYIALQDSDDWSHPDRLAKSIAVLLKRPDIVGLTTDWLRMTTEGDIVIKAGGQISHLCCISLVFRRSAMEKVGFFDSVRIAADLEFIQRLGLSYGVNAVPRLRWPLLFGRSRSDSLTASEEFGLSRIGFTEPRQLYHDASEAFHEAIARGTPAFMPFPLRVRKFDAPAIIRPDKGLES